jgi:hypothetical protein
MQILAQPDTVSHNQKIFQPESPLHTRSQANNTRTKLRNENTVTFRDQKVSPLNDSKTNATPKNISATSKSTVLIPNLRTDYRTRENERYERYHHSSYYS